MKLYTGYVRGNPRTKTCAACSSLFICFDKLKDWLHILNKGPLTEKHSGMLWVLEATRTFKEISLHQNKFPPKLTTGGGPTTPLM